MGDAIPGMSVPSKSHPGEPNHSYSGRNRPGFKATVKTARRDGMSAGQQMVRACFLAGAHGHRAGSAASQGMCVTGNDSASHGIAQQA